MNSPTRIAPWFFAGLLTLAAQAPPVSAAGYCNLGWGDCAPAAPQAGVTFACNTNVGAHLIYGSFEPPVPLAQLVGIEITMAVSSSQSSLSPWWHFESGGCHDGGMQAAFDFRSGPFTCVDPWVGEAAGGLDYNPTFYLTPDRARLRVAVAVATPRPVSPGQEYYAFAIAISHSKTVGTGSCAGCSDGACFQLFSMKLVQPAGVGDYMLTSGPQTMLTWNGGTATDCITPARSRTWGAVKSLYR